MTAPNSSNAEAAPQGDGFETAPPSSPAPDAADLAGGVVSGEGSAAGAATADDVQRVLAEQQDRYLRLAAEYDNHRRRSHRERQEAGARAQADLVKHLIDALDDLSRFAHVDPASTDAATVVQGVDMVERKLHKALGAAGLEVINPEGQAFDPSRHEAVATEPAASRDDDARVARVYQVGYTFGGQLLRPARVVVRQY
jgi:molecular chaperone GrpE